MFPSSLPLLFILPMLSLSLSSSLTLLSFSLYLIQPFTNFCMKLPLNILHTKEEERHEMNERWFCWVSYLLNWVVWKKTSLLCNFNFVLRCYFVTNWFPFVLYITKGKGSFIQFLFLFIFLLVIFFLSQIHDRKFWNLTTYNYANWQRALLSTWIPKMTDLDRFILRPKSLAKRSGISMVFLNFTLSSERNKIVSSAYYRWLTTT